MYVDSSPLERISPSMISTYLDCPENFYYTYIAKLHLPKKQIHLEFGSAVHYAIEQMYKGAEDPIAHFKEHFDITKLLDNEKEEYESHIELGVEMLTNYFEQHTMYDKLYELSPGMSEKYIRRELINPITGETTSLPISGILDRLTDSGRIIEYKTSKNKWKVDETRFKVQNLVYNLWYYSEFGRLAEETVYFILLKKFKNHKRDQTVQVITSNVTIDELASAFDEIELIIKKIQHGIFERDESQYHAKWCDCYRYKEALNITN
jgi:CRISPR/Cas system-associated exonuclease Cas4 (RecB family)